MTENYIVTVRNKPTGFRWTMTFPTYSFHWAESLAKEHTDQQQDEEIIKIEKEYDDDV